MDFLVIRTAVPFGYVFAALVLIALAVVAAGLLVAGTFSPRRRKLLVPGAALGVVLALVVWANLDAEQVNWSPIVHGTDALVGTWKRRGDVLVLRANGTYECRGRACGEAGASGRWERHNDFYVAFRPKIGVGVEWRLTSRDGRLRFATGDTSEDPDTWHDVALTFEHQD